MHWTFAQMIAYASRDSVVLPGDLLASGTTGGGGCLAELWGRNGEQTPPPLEPGDEVSIDVEASACSRAPSRNHLSRAPVALARAGRGLGG